MEDEPERRPPLTAEQEAERRKVVLAERHRARNRRRWIGGGVVLATSALVGAGAVAAWNSQAHAEFAAAAIEQWRDDRDVAECELDARLRDAVRAEQRASDVLPDARAIPEAAGVFGDAERAAFAEEGLPSLEAMAEGRLLEEADRARASIDRDAPDMEACLAGARERRAPIGSVTAERADALARQWRALGDPADVDDERVVELESTLQRLGELAAATARSRAEVALLRSSFEAAPADAFDRFDAIDAELAELTADELAGTARVFDVIGLLSDRATAARDVEAAAVAAAEEAAATAEQPAPPAIEQPTPARPRPVQPPPVDAPVEPAPGAPMPPAPPAPVPPAPSEPLPSIPPPPETPGPEPEPEPEPELPPIPPVPDPGTGGLG
ncbi:hypothetical protein [Microbacterium sp.]|uniref:hypothetical protein n=1 Tax=Microbacterium sp. TaxID=51671 RepID=UPI002811BB09|nr:hypothetical protein [Microbacterium sp.]